MNKGIACYIVLVFLAFQCYAQSVNLYQQSFKTIDGKTFSATGSRATVFVFYSTSCPICKLYTKTLRETIDSFARHSIKLCLIFPGEFFSKREIKKFQKEYNLKATAILDKDMKLALLFDARVTPEAFVIDSTGLRYRGKIDNWFEDIGKHRTVITQHHLADALDAILAGKKIAVEKTEAVGCFITSHYRELKE